MFTEIDFSLDRLVQIAEHVWDVELATVDCGQALIQQLRPRIMITTSFVNQRIPLDYPFDLLY
jgi:hypothetical protein